MKEKVAAGLGIDQSSVHVDFDNKKVTVDMDEADYDVEKVTKALDGSKFSVKN